MGTKGGHSANGKYAGPAEPEGLAGTKEPTLVLQVWGTAPGDPHVLSTNTVIQRLNATMVPRKAV